MKKWTSSRMASAAEQLEVGTQERIRHVEPAEAEGSQCPFFGVANREIQIEPVYQESHPVRHRVLPEKKNPLGP